MLYYIQDSYYTLLDELSNGLTMKGEMSRSSYWTCCFCLSPIFAIIGSLLPILKDAPIVGGIFSIASLLLSLGYFILSICWQVRRYHDVSKTGRTLILHMVLCLVLELVLSLI